VIAPKRGSCNQVGDANDRNVRAAKYLAVQVRHLERWRTRSDCHVRGDLPRHGWSISPGVVGAKGYHSGTFG